MADNFFGITDTGRQRDNNEDAFITQKLANGWVLACVIDGVGGYEGGEIAAAIAKEAIVKKLKGTINNPADTLKAAVWEANKNIYEEKIRSANYDSMACVLTVALADVDSNQFYYAHVGDTRMYLLRDGSLIKQTKDHSFVGFLEDSGRLSEKEAMEHPKRNEINKALGFDGNINVEDDYIETGSSPFLPGDILLLCSDGLTDMVNNQDMVKYLVSATTLKQKTEALVLAANKAGGKDNITAVVVSNTKKPLKQRATKPVNTNKKNDSVEEETVTIEEDITTVVAKKKRLSVTVVILSLLSLLLAALAFWLWTRKSETEKPVPPTIAITTTVTEAEQRLTDSITLARKRWNIPFSMAAKAITISDTIFVRQDSLHIIGNGITLQGDSSYAGPVFFVTANCKYLLLENIHFKNLFSNTNGHIVF